MVSKKKNRAYGLGSPLQDVFPEPVKAQRAPTTSDTGYEIGQIWVDQPSGQMYGLASVASGSATWSLLGPGASDVDTLTGDTGGALSPTAGNINILGGDGLSVAGSGSTLTINRDAAGGYPITPYVVGSSGEAGYATIQSAVNAANSAGGGMVYIQPGTYTEDLTLYDQVHLVSVIYEDATPVTINGSHTPPASGAITARGISFVDAASIFSSGVAGTTNISCEECTFGVTNGHTFFLTNWTGTINCNDCGSSGTNDGFFYNTAGANVFTNNGQFGAGTTQIFTANGDTRFDLTYMNCPVNITAGSIFHNFALFSQTVTISGTATGTIVLGNFFPATGPAIDLTSSGGLELSNCNITTANDPAIDGSGSITLAGVSFAGSSNLAATLTISTASDYVSGSFQTLSAGSGMTISGSDIDADGSDANISITASPKGTGDFVVDVGDIQNTAGDLLATRSNSGGDVTCEVTNSDNTSVNSRAGFEAAVGGSSAGDPYVNFLIRGGQTFTMGIDNSSANDDFVIADDAFFGTNDRLIIDGSTGDTNIRGNLRLPAAATQLQVEGGAATDFIGQATLVLGTVTVANTNISANDKVLVTRKGAAASTTLGVLSVSISAGVSFTIDSLQPATPGSVETGDVSILSYFIVRAL